MLHLRRLEIEGFGPYPERTVITFPDEDGVTVVYGDNMRGKTSLLNAMFYAFYGVVRGRNLRKRSIAHASNRDRARDGTWGFIVSLAFRHDEDEYDLVRRAVPKVEQPVANDDFAIEVFLRRNGIPLGPAERAHALATVLPEGVARFFLFDGELLSQYEELLDGESEDSATISAAIEQILGVPVLKAGRAHLTGLADSASRDVAREAAREQGTQAMGTALAGANERKAAHGAEKARLEIVLVGLIAERKDVEDYLRTRERYAAALASRDEAKDALRAADAEEAAKITERKVVMTDAWRTLLDETVRAARTEAEIEVRDALADVITTLRLAAIETGHCDACDQDVPGHVKDHLAAMIPDNSPARMSGYVSGAGAMARVADLGRFHDVDVRTSVRLLTEAIDTARMAQVTLKDRIGDLDAELADSDEEVLRTRRATLSDLADKIASAQTGIAAEALEIAALEANIANWTERLANAGTAALAAASAREQFLRKSASVFGGAVDRYKADLRDRVEATATGLFLAMTTEKHDYAGLSINENYGLAIRHVDGEIEEGASAAAQQVVALALMGALQANAPLRGPIVMDTPFSRLDRGHKENVVRTLPSMARQVILFVQEGEITREQMREYLGARLLREYQLEGETSRRTLVVEVQ